MSSEPSIDQSVAELCASKPPDYDMKDSEDSGCWPHLEPTLQYCETAVSPAYYAADSAARRHQRRHKSLVLIAAIGGMFAVLLAIMQLYLVGSETPLVGASLVQPGEIVAAAVAGLAVALGLLAVFSSKWLLERERAERCRLVKFRFLLTPELWSRAQPEDRLDLQKENSPQMKLEVLRHIEKVFEAERREWLRLMRETEWFG